MKKIIVLGVFVFMVFSCADKKSKAPMIDAKKLFKQNCMICHGLNGKLGLNGSKDLTKSSLSKEERIAIIKNGKGTMTSFGAILSADEINAVAAYTFQLK